MLYVVLMAFLTPLAHASISYNFGYVLLATNLIAAMLVYKYLYETVSLSLENIDAMYSEPMVDAKNSHRWCPPGYINRKQRSGGVLEPPTELDDLQRFRASEIAHASLEGEEIEKIYDGDVIISVRTRTRNNSI